MTPMKPQPYSKQDQSQTTLKVHRAYLLKHTNRPRDNKVGLSPPLCRHTLTPMHRYICPKSRNQAITLASIETPFASSKFSVRLPGIYTSILTPNLCVSCSSFSTASLAANHTVFPGNVKRLCTSNTKNPAFFTGKEQNVWQERTSIQGMQFSSARVLWLWLCVCVR